MDRLYVADNLKAENQNDLDSISAQLSIIPHSEISQVCKSVKKGAFGVKQGLFRLRMGKNMGFSVTD
jgi:hypothetical protein